MYICICSGVTTQDIVNSEATTIEDVKMLTGACNNCQTCYNSIIDVLNEQNISLEETEYDNKDDS